MNLPNPRYSDPTQRIIAPCGKCVACLEIRRGEWTNRLRFELKSSTSAHFLTLTYSDENLTFGENHPTLVKRDLQLFIKRLRKYSEPSKIRYYAVGEYGTETFRPHYHLIIFNTPQNAIEQISKIWNLGHIQIGTVSPGSIHYVTKYHVNKNITPGGCERSFALMSRKPGIGYGYVEQYAPYHEGNIDRNYILHDGGVKSRLPRYYKDKLYNDIERSRIARKAIKESGRWLDDEVINEHYQVNPDVNYFDYKVQQTKNYEDSYKFKINKKNQL